jgi:hypothetical protein
MFFLVKEKGGSDPSTATIHLSRFFFHSAATPSSTLVPVTAATKFCSPSLPCFPLRCFGRMLLVVLHCWQRATRKQAASSKRKEKQEGEDLGPYKIHQISLQILDFWVKVILN